ncbi:MAG TPA: hypothetical protein VJT15_20220 [Pyrinomonadaceae bacterium]|nr:hypothetical protein [Pyrinomonadaceae bacterium]
MQDNPNTRDNQHESAPTDKEVWEILFEPYACYPDAAYQLARHLTAVKQHLQAKPPEISAAVRDLTEACDALFPFTEFSEAGYDLYRVAIAGHATRAEENLMESLGIKY